MSTNYTPPKNAPEERPTEKTPHGPQEKRPFYKFEDKKSRNVIHATKNFMKHQKETATHPARRHWLEQVTMK